MNNRNSDIPTKSVTARHTSPCFAISELVAINLPGKPTSARAWYKLVQREKWPELLEPGRGGRDGGKVRKYQPPPEVQALIDAHQRGELPAVSKYTRKQATEIGRKFGKTMREVGDEQKTPFINVACLARCLDAVDSVAATQDVKMLSTERRLHAAIWAYRTLRQSVLSEPLDLVAYLRLAQREFDAAATLALSLTLMDAQEPEPEDGDGLSIASF